MNEDKDKGKENKLDIRKVLEYLKKLLKKESEWTTKIVLFILLIAAGYFAYEAVMFYYTDFYLGTKDEFSKWGQFGDYFGGVLNPILSFLALIALLYTIVLQSKELALTREELRRSSKAHEEQSKTLKSSYEQTERFRAIDLIYNDDLKAGPRLKAEAVKTYVQVERIRIAREQKEAEENGSTPPENDINLSNAKLENVILIGFDLNHVNFFETNLTDAHLMRTTLNNVYLGGADLKNIEYGRNIKSIKGANITGVKNAPDGFIELALENEAVIDPPDSETPTPEPEGEKNDENK